jgi:deoxyadenosine/deoxycytidine kinase
MPENNNFFLAIAGNIGSGKSSLTTLLSQHFQWKAFYEIVEQNPYLNDFYSDMRRWSFHTQMFFLSRRFRHLLDIQNSAEPIVQDRSIFEDAEIFAKNLYLSGKMDERDYKCYLDHFQMMSSYMRAPDLIVYLKSDLETLSNRISQRGRNFESQMDRDYLKRLNQMYDQWADAYQRGPIVIIDVSKKDFVNKAEDLRQVVSIVRWEIECLQNPSQTALPLKSTLNDKTRKAPQRELT